MAPDVEMSNAGLLMGPADPALATARTIEKRKYKAPKCSDCGQEGHKKGAHACPNYDKEKNKRKKAESGGADGQEGSNQGSTSGDKHLGKDSDNVEAKIQHDFTYLAEREREPIWCTRDQLVKYYDVSVIMNVPKKIKACAVVGKFGCGMRLLKGQPVIKAALRVFDGKKLKEPKASYLHPACMRPDGPILEKLMKIGHEEAFADPHRIFQTNDGGVLLGMFDDYEIRNILPGEMEGKFGFTKPTGTSPISQYTIDGAEWLNAYWMDEPKVYMKDDDEEDMEEMDASAFDNFEDIVHWRSNI